MRAHRICTILILCFRFLVSRDFPGGQGESQFVGRASAGDVPSNDEARRLYGLQAFVPDAQKGLSKEFAEKVNSFVL